MEADVATITDPHEPDYCLSSFPRDDFPRYDWASRPATLPPKVWTTETTHRDGQQGGLPLTTDQSLAIYDLHCRFTGSSGAIRQAEFFVYRQSDRAALEGALERFRGGAPIEPTTWIRAATKDVELIKSLGVRETGMLASISDYHTFHKFTPGGRVQAADTYLDAARMALEAGIRPRLHLEDATRAPTDFVLAFIDAVLTLAEPFGPDLRPKFRVCDTMGLGLPYDDVALPRSIPLLFRRLRSLGLQPEDLEFHPHNDTWLIVANCLAAIREGCAAINGTCLGKGERTGNAPLEGVLLHIIGMGYFADDRPDFTVLNELAALYARIGEPLPPTYPLYGRDAHRTRAGIHADGLNKFWWMYAPFDVPGLLGRPLEVSLTKDSGLAGLIFLIKQHLGLDLDKHDDRLRALNDRVTREFDAGRQTGFEWEELQPLVDRYLASSPHRSADGA
jgi:2-phosphinomethylmalic acid synthase